MKLALVCSHGGHLTELSCLLPAFEGHERFFVTYLADRTITLLESEHVYLLKNIGINPLLMAMAFMQALLILMREKPDVVISTGSEIAIPVFVAAKLLRLRTLFIESFCRVNTPSFTGRVLYPLADVFFVQWPSLLSHYGSKARYEGAVA